MKIITRPGKESDVGFAVATWRRSFRWPGEPEDVRAHMDRALHRVLSTKSGQFEVACSKESPDTLVGWALSEGGHLLWFYVSRDYRGKDRHLGRLLKSKVVTLDSSASVGPQERE